MERLCGGEHESKNGVRDEEGEGDEEGGEGCGVEERECMVRK